MVVARKFGDCGVDRVDDSSDGKNGRAVAQASDRRNAKAGWSPRSGGRMLALVLLYLVDARVGKRECMIAAIVDHNVLSNE
jgi:hypothetical protein